jgi:hypothetical protein
LQTPDFTGPNLPRRVLLLKALFLTALAFGNCVLELAEVVRSGITFLINTTRALLPVISGFLFKNQLFNS